MSTIKSSTTTTTAYSVEADTTGALVIQTGAGPTTAVTVGSDQSVTFAQAANLPNTFGFKNRLINSAMVIDQRNAGAAVTTGGANPVDRFAVNITSAGTYSGQQSTAVVPDGFTTSIGFTVTSSDGTLDATDNAYISQWIEGNNIADLGFGSASAKTITISFWVRGSVTGTYCVVLLNSSSNGTAAPNRSYVAEYSISSANTWEYKTISILGDTSGTWHTGTGRGFHVRFGLSAGTSLQQVAGSWGTGNVVGSSNQTNIMATNGATFYITGVQLEKGSTATSFDYRPYGTELALCQRYYEKTLSQGTTSSTGQTSGALIAIAMSTTQMAAQWTFKQTKRTTPTLTLFSFNGTSGAWASNSSNADFTVTQPWGVGDNGFARLDSTGMTAGAAYWGFAVASAEL